MSEVEVERLVVKLVGDGSDYQKMMQEVVESSKKTADAVEKVTEEVKKQAASLKDFGATLVSLGAAIGVKNVLKGAFDSFKEQEAVQFKLKAAIEANGFAVDETYKRFRAFSTELRNQTGFSIADSTALFQLAQSMGYNVEESERAVKTAVALAAAQGGSAESYIRVAKAIQDGNPAQLRGLRAVAGIKDGNEKLAKAQELVTRAYEVAKAAANTTEGVMARYTGTMKALTKQFGQMVAEAIVPTVKWLTKVMEQFVGLDERTKRVIVSVLLFLSALVSFGPAWAAIAKVGTPLIAAITQGFSLIFTAVKFLFSPLKVVAALFSAIAAAVGFLWTPITLVVIAVVAAVLLLVNYLGGFKKVWELVRDWALAAWERVKQAGLDAWAYIQAKVQEFVEWSRPIRQAIESLFAAVWETVRDAAVTAWDWIKDKAEYVVGVIKILWQDMTGATKVNWSAVRDFIVDALLTVEFGIRNIGKVWDLTITWVSLKLVTLGQDFAYFFTGTLPALLSWFGDNWQALLTDMVVNWANANSNMWQNMFNVFKNLPGLIAGTVDFADVWIPMTRGMQKTFQDLPEIAKRPMSDLEKALQADLEAQAKALGVGLDEFKRRKKEEFANEPVVGPEIPPKAKDDATKVGTEVGKVTAKAAKAAGIDTALAGTAEALRRVQEYAEQFAEYREGKGKNGKGPGLDGGVRTTAGGAGNVVTERPVQRRPEDAAKQDQTFALMKNIDLNVAAISRAQGNESQPANLGGA